MIIESPNSISDQVYEYLKSQILQDEIDPGMRLTQEKVAEAVNTSRTPVREAFRRLEQEGLVERVPQGGVRVTSVDPESVAKKFDVREALEVYAIGLACERATPEWIAELESIRDQADALLRQNDLKPSEKIKRFFDLNTTFHDTIYDASGNPYLIRMIRQFRQMVLPLRAMGLRDDSTWTQVWTEHSRLIRYLKSGKKQAAMQCVSEHIKNAAIYVSSVIDV